MEVWNGNGNGNGSDPDSIMRGLRITNESDDDDLEQGEGNVVVDELDDDEYEDEDVVTLGFVQKPKNHWSLLRQLFPSKAGGVPAWLIPNEFPSGPACLCDLCGQPLQFLLQVYAPLTDKESTFHRTLYLFICPSMACLLRDQHGQWKRHPEEVSRSVKVFRNQLPRHNAYYSSEPPKHDGTDEPSVSGAALCDWCSTWRGNKLCGNCKKIRYCSEKHQVLHWRSGHKVDCHHLSVLPEIAASTPGNEKTASRQMQKGTSKNLWPEFEIVNEDETEYDPEMSDQGNSANAIVSLKNDKIDESLNSLLSSFESDGDRNTWATFQERISRAPEQILRYCRNATSKPLWPMLSGRPSKADIPGCSHCGGPRCFEFQVLPQLLYYFGVKNDADCLDWGTIAVYTCEASCEGSLAYKEEFAWVQLTSQTS